MIELVLLLSEKTEHDCITNICLTGMLTCVVARHFYKQSAVLVLRASINR